MKPWWPSYALTAWRDLSSARRVRASVLLTRLAEKERGIVIGQTAFVNDLVRFHRQAYGPTVELIDELVEKGILRRKRKQKTVVLWIPDHLLDEAMPAHVDDLVAGA